MSLLQGLDPGPRALRLVLIVLIQVTLVILAALVVTRTKLRRRAAERHRVWLFSLMCTLFGPVVVVVLECAGWTLPILPWTRLVAEGATAARGFDEPAAITFERGAEPVDVEPADPVAARVDAVEKRASSPVVAPPRAVVEPIGLIVDSSYPETSTLSAPSLAGSSGRAIVGALVLVWAAGLVIGLGRFAVDWHRLRRLKTSCRPFDPGDRIGVSAEVREALDGRALPPIVVSPEVSGPITIGLLEPMVILPEGSAAELTARELRDVLIHECAHAMRRDTLVGALQRLAAAIYWPHPLVHRMNSSLARAREEVCDNFVLRRGDPCGYARTLLELTERCRPGRVARAGVGLMDARWTLGDRIAGLLDPGRDAMTKPNRRTAGVAVLTLATTCLVIAGVRPAGPPAAEARTPGEPADARAVFLERIVRGVVVDQAGRPAAGATVRPVRGAIAGKPVKTAADGRFTLVLDGFMVVEENLVASAEGGALLGLGKHVEPESTDPAEPVRIVVEPSRTVSVHVRDAGGKPVEGAAVEALGDRFQATATTGANGDAALRIPAEAKLRWIIGLKPGVGFDYFENSRSRPALDLEPTPAEATLTLEGARTARIRAVDSMGRPVPNLEFRPAYIKIPTKLDFCNPSGAEIARARTDERGVAVFDWLPPAVDQGVPFVVSPGAYSCPERPVYRPAPDGVELEARMLRRTPIRGVVREADGRPAPGVLLRAEGRGATSQYCRVQTRTAQDGSYLMEVDRDQSYIIAVLDDRRAARSLTGVVVRDGQPRAGLDLALVEGTLLRGRVVKRLDATPAAGEFITLVQQGDELPREFLSDRGNGPTENLVRSAKTDAEGRYRIRVGPGRYSLYGPDLSARKELTVETEKEIESDFSTSPRSTDRRILAGVAVERTAAGDRPIAGAIVEASPLGRTGFESRAIADGAGRFRLSVDPERDLVIYVRDPAGKVAGFTSTKANADEVRALAAPAARIHGRVVDHGGRPQAGRSVQLRLDSGAEHRESGHFFATAMTDPEGRYDFRGAVVGANVEVSTSHAVDRESGGGIEVETLSVRSPDPLEVPDLVVSETDAAAARAEASRPRVEFDPRDFPSLPAAPTRAEVEALVHAIGRDPATPELVDRAWLLTRPHFQWSVDARRVGTLVADQDFTRRVDDAARAVLGRPADTSTLLAQAISYHVGRDAAYLENALMQKAEAESKPRPTVKGKVVAADSGRPIAGAIVFTADALARTDAAGAFSIRPPSPPRQGLIWVEAEGFATAEYRAWDDAGNPLDVRAELVAEAPVIGRVVGPDGRPISGATVTAWLKHYDFLRPRPDPAPSGDYYTVKLDVRTDEDGRFSFRGLPPGLAVSWYEAGHPEHRTRYGSRSPLEAGEPRTIRLEAGCKVAGILVDEQGRPIRGAMVEIRKPGRFGTLFSTHTADDGRYRFGGVAPGRWMVVIQPERHAPIIAPVVATLDRPVENQHVAVPGSYVGGKVIGSDGKPVARAAVGWVRPVDERGQTDEGLYLSRTTYTTEDGTFRLGPLSLGRQILTSLIDRPRRSGRVEARANETNVVIRLEPEAGR